nr:transketolase family protein [Clostridia bacterium]
PVYMRFGRFAVPYLYGDDYKFEIGKGIVMADGKDATIVATGLMVHIALEARELLKAEGIDAAVINIHTIKPLDDALLAEYAAKTGAVVTAEEHSIIGGLGSAVCESLAATCPVPVMRVGTEDTFGRSGKVPPLLEMYGLTAQNIAAKAKASIALKK